MRCLERRLHIGVTLFFITGLVGTLYSAAAPQAKGNLAAKQELFSRFFPNNIKFERPLWFEENPKKPGTYFVVEQGGHIYYMVKDKHQKFQKEEFLNIKVNRGPNEMGLLGFALHPNFTQNGLYYINYNPGQKKETVIEERKAAQNFTRDSRKHSRVLLKLKQPYGNHNGGCLAFGPDGYLYIGVGDGGKWGDPLKAGQDTTTYLGSILRIDVNKKESGGAPYGIPQDNPFAKAKGKVKKEIYSYGLRNPWRFSFDFKTGNLWVGDVGQNEYEEISLVQSGDNMGWSIMEGFTCYDSEDCKQEGLKMPILQISSDEARSITGGYVYRGNPDSPYYGAYVFGDFVTEKIWSLTLKDGKKENLKELGTAPGSIASFGRDIKGNIYMVCFDGRVYRFNL